MGKGSNTSTTTTQPNAGAMAAYQQLLQRARGVASTPYQAYTGDLTAPINAQQYSGVNNINANAGFASPFIQQAAGNATAAAQPLSQAQIQNYLSPYTQNVVDATQGQFNLMNRQALNNIQGNAAAQGALGGDRVGVADAAYYGAALPGQQQAIAGLYNQGYGQAVQTAQQQQQNLANSAYSLGNLGVSGQNAALQGAGAQFGVGTAEQQTEQARLNALYNQFQIAQAFPYQQAQWLAGIDTGVGSQLGGTSTTTGPAPNPLTQIAGLGVAGAGVAGNLGWKPFAARGGRIQGFADGGMPGMPYAGVSGYVPTVQLPIGNTMPHGGGAGVGASGQSQQGGVGGLGNLSQIMGMGRGSSSGASSSGVGSTGGIEAEPAGLPVQAGEEGGFGSFMSGLGDSIEAGVGGLGDALGAGVGALGDIGASAAEFLPFLLLKRGGGVRGYDDGGDVEPIEVDQFPGQGVAPAAMDAWRHGVDEDMGRGVTATDYAAPVAGVGASPIPAPRPQNNYPVVPLRAGVGALPGDALGYAGDESEAGDVGGVGGVGADTARRTPAPREGGSQPWANALLAAGLGMMASRSPFLLSGIGEGGLTGLQQYAAEKQQAIKHEEAVAKLDQQAKLAQQHLAAQTAAQQATAEYRKAALNKPHPSTDEKGRPILIYPDGHSEMVTPGGGGTAPVAAGAQPVSAKTVEEQGEIPATAQWVANGPHDYSSGVPFDVKKGYEIPAPAPVGNFSSDSIKTAAERYLQTGQRPVAPAAGRNPASQIAVRDYQIAAMNYANAIAASRGMSPEDVADAWRTSPLMGRFIMGADGRATVSLGTAVRHLDSLKQLGDAWYEGSKTGNWQAWNRLQAAVGRQFGDSNVTNLDSASKIIGAEIIKALGVAGAGSEGERAHAADAFAAHQTPDQFAGAIKTVQTLLGGQLEGKEGQAKAAGLTDAKFKQLIGERPYELLKGLGGGAAGAGSTQPKPTQADINYARTHPEVRDKFIKRFGVEP